MVSMIIIFNLVFFRFAVGLLSSVNKKNSLVLLVVILVWVFNGESLTMPVW